MSVRNRSILMLEDDLVQSMMVQKAMANMSAEVSNFLDVSDAVRVMKQASFDLCLVDLGVFLGPDQYSDLGGLRFIREVRGAGYRTVPILIATNERNPETLLPAFKAGGDDYVLKDEGIQGLSVRVRKWLTGGPYTEADLVQRRDRVLDYLDRTMWNGLGLV